MREAAPRPVTSSLRTTSPPPPGPAASRSAPAALGSPPAPIRSPAAVPPPVPPRPGPGPAHARRAAVTARPHSPPVPFRSAPPCGVAPRRRTGRSASAAPPSPLPFPLFSVFSSRPLSFTSFFSPPPPFLAVFPPLDSLFSLSLFLLLSFPFPLFPFCPFFSSSFLPSFPSFLPHYPLPLSPSPPIFLFPHPSNPLSPTLRAEPPGHIAVERRCTSDQRTKSYTLRYPSWTGNRLLPMGHLGNSNKTHSSVLWWLPMGTA